LRTASLEFYRWSTVKVWIRSFPNSSQKVSSRLGRSLEEAEAYARHLFEVSLQDGFGALSSRLLESSSGRLNAFAIQSEIWGNSANAIVGLPPDFLCSLVAPAQFMRLSVKKAAYVVASSAAYRKSGSPHRFRPRYAPRHAGTGLATLGHPSYSFWPCYDTDRKGRLKVRLVQISFFQHCFIGPDDVRGGRVSWQLFLKFDIFGSLLRLVAQRGRANGFFFIEKGTLKSGT
jgi:hypothetical protein